ncbi:hypothetical protein [Emticicia sp. SJ17W-69]|uniref:hypothetical protein n=1 Tax=Emticicia sp. SJ17W-69 TaxID=3421657 RepID=UPI003EBB7E3A
MKNSILLKSLFLTAFVFCFENADAQLASDTPAPVVNKTFVTSKQDSAKVLASDTPTINQSNSKAKKSSPPSDKTTLPSERIFNKQNELSSPKKQ